MVHKYHTFAHSPDGGHLSCFLVIVNNFAMKAGVMCCLNVFELGDFFFSNIPRSGITGSYDCFIFSFSGIPMLSSIVVAPIYNPTTVFEVSHFFTSSSAFVICCLLDGNHSKTCEVMHLCYD